MNNQPPKWADRFLRWYCSPELLEEIQGDAHELYTERFSAHGKRSADLHYVWDVLRFFRWSNIKRTENGFVPGSMGALWSMNFKMAVRNARKNKMIFVVKTLGLAVCLAFALLLTAYVVNELTFDKFNINHSRIYRITSKVNFQDHVTHYAVTPLPIGQTLVEEIPEVENYFRFWYEDKPIFRVDDRMVYDEVTLAADSNFFNILTFDFVQGNTHALMEPNKIVVTESLATKLFGTADVLGRTLTFGKDNLLEVSGVIRNVPSNSHLKFDAAISWTTFDRDNSWGNVNAYTYILLKPEANLEIIKNKMPKVLSTFYDLAVREYKATFELIFENITDIHFSGPLDEDIAQKRNKNNLVILAAVVCLFLITGLINYLNLTLAELTANLKKIRILRVFGGLMSGHKKILLTETTLALLTVLPFVSVLCYEGLILANNKLGIQIDGDIFLKPLFILSAVSFLVLLFISTGANSYVLSKTGHIVHSLKGKLSAGGNGLSTRKFLVATQLSFSILMIALILVIVDQFNFIQNSDKGFDDKDIVVIKLRNAWDQAMRTETFIETIRKISGVSKVEGSTYFPGVIETKYVFEVETDKGMEQRLIPMMICSNEYLDALNVIMIKGHGFKNYRSIESPGTFIVNETAAREFGWKDAIGKMINGPVTGQGEANIKGEVIGLAKDFNFASLHNAIEPMIIIPANQGWTNYHFIYVKVNPLRPRNLVSTLEKVYKAQWPEYPFEWEYLDSKYLSLYRNDYEVKRIFQIGLVISILTSCLGIFSISALLVTLRTKEMGIRKVVGASSIHLFFLHTNSFLKSLFIAALVAWPVIWFLSREWLSTFAYHVSLNIWYFIVPGIIALLITGLTSAYHGIKSAMVNPVDILKHE
jgi:putative ABC transport system permease protein